jgi:peptide/nickel transport system permease protein
MTDVGLEAIVSGRGLDAPQRGRSVSKLFRHRSFVIGFAIIAALTLAAIFAPLLTSLDPSAMKVRLRFRPPAPGFIFGTDMFGRDIFTRVLYGARVSLFVGLAVSVISGFCGAVIGVVAAQFRRLDAPIMRLMDALMSFPAILLALGIAAARGSPV